MKAETVSLRQIAVLTVTGLLAPAADVLPGLLAGSAGRSAWLIPLMMLPVLLAWSAVLTRLFRQEGSGLFSLLRYSLGKSLGWFLTLLYIMWAIRLLWERMGRCAARMGAVYGGGVGELMAALVLLLAVWMVWGKRGAIYRAGELFWLAVAAAVAAVLLLALPQIKGEYLLPARDGWAGSPRSWLQYLNVWATMIFGTALFSHVPRKYNAARGVMGWITASCLLSAGLLAAVQGQMGAELAARLPQPFLIMVQGLSLEGAVARLEGPVAALWLLSDFCRMGLLLLVLREAGGEKRGKWVAAAGAAAAFAGQLAVPAGAEAVSGGVLLGILLPVCLWLLAFCRKRREDRPTSCGQ